jgi:hypothetical protein
VETTDERDGGSIDPTRIVTTHRAAEGEADGDDIAVIPDGPDESGGRSRRRVLFLGAALLAAVALVAGVIALSARDDGSKTPAAVRTTSPSPKVPVAEKIAPTTVVHKKPRVVAPTTVPATAPPATVATTPRNQVVPPASVATPPPVITPTTPAPPKQYGTSVLTWNAPGRLTVASGHAATFSVTAHNPTDGTVTLPHPLSCTPRLDHGEMCSQVVQIIAAGGSASAGYTIDAHGVAAGSYQLRIEGALTIPVTVTASPSH